MAQRTQPRNTLVGAVALILLGIAALVVPQLPDGSLRALLPLVFGLIFAGWGFFARNAAILIPGLILCGFGLGLYLAGVPFRDESSSIKGGVFWLSVAVGWILIALLAPSATHTSQRWALIPGIIFAVIGAAMFGGTTFKDLVELHVDFSVWVNNWWPVLLIVFGIFILIRGQTKQRA